MKKGKPSYLTGTMTATDTQTHRNTHAHRVLARFKKVNPCVKKTKKREIKQRQEEECLQHSKFIVVSHQWTTESYLQVKGFITCNLLPHWDQFSSQRFVVTSMLKITTTTKWTAKLTLHIKGRLVYKQHPLSPSPPPCHPPRRQRQSKKGAVKTQQT